MDRLLNRFGLRFLDGKDEQAFFQAYCSRNLPFLRIMLAVGGVLLVFFTTWDRILDPVTAPKVFWLRWLVMGPTAWAAALLLFYKRWRRRSELIMTSATMVASSCIAIICGTLSGGLEVAGGALNLVVLFLAALMPVRFPWYLLFCGWTFASYLVAQGIAPPYRAGLPLVNTIMLLTAMFLGGVAVVSREAAARRQFTTRRELVRSRGRIEELLLSILPSGVVRRIQSGETLIADLHHEVSIVFADLCGFTELSRRLDATQLVHILNRLFSAFDRVAGLHKMQKIKTIGDAYMAVGGLVAGEDMPARSAAAFAIGLNEATAALSQELGIVLDIRIGLHVGPVVAGVIGTSRPAFDCWGEAVNLASRLESSARAGDILLSEGARDALLGEFDCERIEDVVLKGFGLTRTFRIVREERGSREVTAIVS